MKVVDRFISVDVETSGPIPGEFSLLALGACVVNEEDKQIYLEFQPTSSNFDPKAMQTIGRPLDYFIKEGQSASKAIRSLDEWLKRVSDDTKPVFVGFNAPFDWSFVNYYFLRFLGSNPFGFAALDIKSFYAGLTGCTWDETRSSRILPEYKPPLKHSHNALEDALEQSVMFSSMLKAARAAKQSGSTHG